MSLAIFCMCLSLNPNTQFITPLFTSSTILFRKNSDKAGSQTMEDLGGRGGRTGILVGPVQIISMFHTKRSKHVGGASIYDVLQSFKHGRNKSNGKHLS